MKAERGLIPLAVLALLLVLSLASDLPDPPPLARIHEAQGASRRPGPGGAVGLADQPPVRIHEIQGASHVSPKVDALVSTQGIVTAKRAYGFFLQDPEPDADPATSEAIFVYTGSAPSVDVGDEVLVGGTVKEYRPGGSGTSNLTTTEIDDPGRSVTVLSSDNLLPTPVVLGVGGRIPPGSVIEDDAAGDVEASGVVFDPSSDGLDFYESLEGMRVQVNDAVAVGPRNAYGEIPVVGDGGASAGTRTACGGVLIRPADFNPERIIVDDAIMPTPSVDVGDRFDGPIVGVVGYSSGNYKLHVTTPPSVNPGYLHQEVTTAPTPDHVAIATLNAANLAPGDPASRFRKLAALVVGNLKSPDVVAVEEVQDDNGSIDDSVVDASDTYNTLLSAIQDAGGPIYQFRQIDPVDDQDGGEPGGNIRQGFLFRTDRGLSFVDRPGGTSTAAVSVAGRGPDTHLSLSPGRVAPENPAFANSRKPLAGEFSFKGQRLFVIANHLNSKSGDQPYFGRFQPPTFGSEVQRKAQAQVVNDFVDSILAADPAADVVVLGDLNDFEFSEALGTLKGGALTNLIETLPEGERYTYVYDGNSQTLDHILVSSSLLRRPFECDVVHVNSEFAVRASDHDPVVARLSVGYSAYLPLIWQRPPGP